MWVNCTLYQLCIAKADINFPEFVIVSQKVGNRWEINKINSHEALYVFRV